MFKKVQDDVLLGVSKMISRSNQEKSSLLIDEDDASEKVSEKLDLSIKSEESEIVCDKIEESIKEENSLESDIKEENVTTYNLVDRKEYNEMKEELLSSLKDQIDYLKNQIETKDQQLQNKDELIRNFQVLMKSDKDRIHELESGKVDEVVNTEVEIEENLNEKEIVEKNIRNNNIVEDDTVKNKKRGLLNWFKK